MYIHVDILLLLLVITVHVTVLIKVGRRTSEDLSVFVVFLIKVCRLRRKTFLFLFCFLLLRFPTLVRNLSVFVLSFLINSLFFIFLLLSFYLYSPFIT